MKHGQHNLQRRFMHLLMHIHRDAAAIILDTNGVVCLDGDKNLVGITGKSLVDRVVNHLIHKMMKPSHRGVTNIHRRSLANCFQAFEHLNVICLIFLRFRLRVFLLVGNVVNLVNIHFETYKLAYKFTIFFRNRQLRERL